MYPSGRAEIISRAKQSLKWSILINIAPRFVTPLTSMLLSTLLTPDDFGIVAASAAIVSLGQIVVGLGMGSAIVQCQACLAEAATFAFWITTLLAFSSYVILWILAPWISGVYRIPELLDVIRVSGFSFILYALNTVPSAFMQRNFDFKKMFFINFITLVISGAVALILAFVGARFWALVLGQLAGMGASMILTWQLSGWRPGTVIDLLTGRSLLRFSFWVVLNGLISWFFMQVDNLICGFFLGPATLGVYALGFNLGNLLPALLISSLVNVAYPMFCALKKESNEVSLILLRLQSLSAVIFFPTAFGLSAVAAPTVSLIYGERWPKLDLIIQLMAIMPGISHLWHLNIEVYRALGRPDVSTKLEGITLVVLIPLLIFAAPHGLFAFAVARAVGASLLPILIIFVTHRFLGISVKEQLRVVAIPLGCCLAMFMAAQLFIRLLNPFIGILGGLKLSLLIMASASFYFLSLRLVSKNLWNNFIFALQRLLHYT
jgi:O-antigen/teichoic acid export membrane protein